MNCRTNLGAVLLDLKQHEQALECFDYVLQANPEAVGAMNNKSYVLFRMENFPEAEKWAQKALDLSPNNVDSMINLGIATAQNDKKEEALELWERASVLDPDNSKIWSNWGNTLRDMNRIIDSEEKCRRACELDPHDINAMNNLANALRDQGGVEEPLELYQKSTDLLPENHIGHFNRALLLIDQERFNEALVSARYAIAFEKNNSSYYSALSVALRETDDIFGAQVAAGRAIKLDPDNPEPYIDMADVLLKSDRHDDGLAVLEKAKQLNPDSDRVHMKLSMVQDLLSEYEQALESIDAALALSPASPVLWVQKAMLLLKSSRSEEAIETIDYALTLAPRFVKALCLKAEILISTNNNDEAKDVIAQARAIDDTVPGVYGAMVLVEKLKKDDEDFQRMLDIYGQVCDRGTEAETVMNYAMFKIHEDAKDYDAAFEYLQKASDAKRKTIPYDGSKIPATYENVKKRFPEGFMDQYEGKGYEDSEQAVFIVGMPRSGTTLTEQIISSHPDVYGAGELTDLGRAVRIKGPVSPDTVHDIGEKYIELIRAVSPDPAMKRITDKMPGNYHNIGLIAAALPNAKIIHCYRDPLDNCLSCYKQNFAVGQYWSYDLEELGMEYLRYQDLMDYWRDILPGRFLDVKYEDTVGDFENQARRLIDFIGLEWNEACLKPHKQKRTVLTASKSQVTKPVYQSSVKGWKRYEKQLQPLVQILSPEEAL